MATPISTESCTAAERAKLQIQPGGRVESYADNGLNLAIWFDNDGAIVSYAGRSLLHSTASWSTVHSGYFGTVGGGRLALCGPFLLNDPGSVASGVGLADSCGTIVADVTDFTPAQITDVITATGVAEGLAAQAVDGLPTCEIRGVDLTELYGYYPDECNYTPQQWAADTFTYYIEWMPGFGAALDLGHAIFGRDLSGRELSPSERILDGFFATFPAAVNQLDLDGVTRLRYRAVLRGADDACNSFTPGTPVLMADGHKKAISTIRPGDLVTAYDPATGRTAARPVTKTIIGHGLKHLVDLTYGGHNHLTATTNHPIWQPALNKFVDAGQLRAGDMLRTSVGTWIQVGGAAHRTTRRATVYNLTVADIHTFYVGDTPTLVHNTNPLCRSTASRRLRTALGASPYQNGQAHHILAYAYEKEPIGQRLASYQDPVTGAFLDLNGAINGLWLPRANYPGLDPAFVGAFHNGGNTDAYNAWVLQWLSSATDYTSAASKLSDLRGWLLSGCLPINGSGVRVKPASGTCLPALVDFFDRRGIQVEGP